MNYKSKYTASEIDARLSQVFDSTLQTKEVEVSADTTIKADEGFLGLKEVSVKVSGGGGTASTMEYWDVSSNNEGIGEFALFFPWVRDDNAKNITSAWGLSTPNADITAVALDRNVVIALDGEKMTIGSFLQSAGLEDLTIFGWKQITEEQFYAL